MTSWPEPERPVLRARPPKEFRDEDSSPRRFTRDDRWVLGGLTLAAALLIGYAGYWTNWFGLTAPDTPPPPPSGGEAAPATGTTVGSWVVLGLFAVFSLGVLVWIWWGLRDDGAKLDQLPADEQARRQQIAALLRQVEPPVSEDEAHAALRPPWLDEAARRAAGHSHDAGEGGGGTSR